MPDPPPPIQIFRSTASNKTSVSTSTPVITLASANGGTKLLKSAKNLIKKFVKLTVHTFACNSLTYFLNKYQIDQKRKLHIFAEIYLKNSRNHFREKI